jgi:hypothetical protein
MVEQPNKCHVWLLLLLFECLSSINVAAAGELQAERAPTTQGLVPILAPIGVAEIIWNKTADACPQTKPDPVTGQPKLCESPDSVPIAWNNPINNKTYLISATDCTFAGVAASLHGVRGKHECSASPYVAGREPAPWTYDNHQWLQSVRIFPDGTGFALVHNEFHGEQPPHNSSWCSFKGKTSTGQCILWSSDIATTRDGGTSFQLKHAPVITLPRRYLKDAAKAGYGVLGQIQRQDGYYYSHVSRNYVAGTGAGPLGTSASGTCVFRTQDPDDPTSLRGWNGSAWSTQWVNPYEVDTAADELWKHTCANIHLEPGGQNMPASHLHVKKFAGELAKISGWPTHVMSGLTGGAGGAAYFFPVKGAAPFTAWTSDSESTHEPRVVDVEAWMDPCTVGGRKYKMMYPNLLDHDSPFRLSGGGDDDAKSDGLSYGLVGNTSLHLYFVLERKYIVRVPVAWFLDGQAPPQGPFQPPTVAPPLNSPTCRAVAVKGAGAFDGTYDLQQPANKDGTHNYRMDANHSIYHFQKVWIIGKPGRGGVRAYIAPGDMQGQGPGVPKTWGPCTSITVDCV